MSERASNASADTRLTSSTYGSLVGKGNLPDRAWKETFGNSEGFEAKWKDFWAKQPDHPTLDLYAKAAVTGLVSFLVIWLAYALIYRWPATRMTDAQVDRVAAVVRETLG